MEELSGWLLSEQVGLGGERWPSEKVTPSLMVISSFYTKEFESNRNMALINSFFSSFPSFPIVLTTACRV